MQRRTLKRRQRIYKFTESVDGPFSSGQEVCWIPLELRVKVGGDARGFLQLAQEDVSLLLQEDPVRGKQHIHTFSKVF